MGFVDPDRIRPVMNLRREDQRRDSGIPAGPITVTYSTSVVSEARVPEETPRLSSTGRRMVSASVTM